MLFSQNTLKGTKKVSRGAAPAALALFAIGCVGAAFWSNEAGLATVEPEYLLQPSTAAELVEIAQMAKTEGKRIRMTGSGYSSSEIAITEDVMMIPESLNQPLSVDQSRLYADYQGDPRIVRVQSGIQIGALNEYLDDLDLGLTNLGGYDGQTIVGVAMTATHGSGLDFGPMADQIISMQVVGENGEMFQVEPTDGITDPASFPATLEENSDIPVTLIQDDDTFHAMRVSIGSMGIVYAVTLMADNKFWLEEVKSLTTWSEFSAPGGYLERFLNGMPVYDDQAEPDHMEFQFSPYPTDEGEYTVLLTERYRSYEPLPEEPVSKRGQLGYSFSSFLLAAFDDAAIAVLNLVPELSEGILQQALETQVDEGYTNVSYKVYNIGPANEVDATAIEPAMALEDTIPAVERIFEIADDLKQEGIYHTGPIAVRFIKATDAMLAMQSGRDTASIEIITFVKANGREILDEAYTSTLMSEFDARPHWGLDANRTLRSKADLEATYPDFDIWYEKYQEFNQGTFDGWVTDRLGISVYPR